MGRLIFHVSDVWWVLGVLQGKGTSSGESTRCLMGRTVFRYVRSRRSWAVVCAPDL